MSKIIDSSILLLLGALIGFNLSFTFVIAPVLFSYFDKRLAGEITNLIFPYYFASGWIVGIIIYTLIGIKSIKDKEIIKKLKGFIIGLLLLIISYMALHKTILPIARIINSQYYQLLEKRNQKQAEILKEKFNRIHRVSSGLNIFNIALEIYLFQYYYLRIRRIKED